MLTTSSVVAAAAIFTGCASTPQETLVRRYTEAFNAHDVDAMLALAHPDVEWMSVMGDKVSVDARGHEALRAAMEDYFRSLPTARSEVEGALGHGEMLAVRERAHWRTGAGEDRSQASIAVYEVQEGLVRRVWYFAPSP